MKTLVNLLLLIFTLHVGGFSLYSQQEKGMQKKEVLKAMKKASDYMAKKVSYRGGYLHAYKEDFTEVFGEVPARKTQIWVQSGTPAMGQTFLDLYIVTGDKDYLDYARNAADALIYGQHPLGGWHYFIDFDKKGLAKWYREVASQFKSGWEEFRYYYGNCTFDDNVTQGATEFLLNLYAETLDPAYIGPLKKALNFMLISQYPNGGWPQRYPLRYDYAHDGFDDYTSNYTLNDDAMNNTIEVLLKAWEFFGNEEYLEAARRGGDFLIISQGPEELPAWSEQYDMNIQPDWGRTHEPPAYGTRQTAHSLEILMKLYLVTGDKRYLKPIPATLSWMKSSKMNILENGLYELARYYDPETGLPIDLIILDELTPDGKLQRKYFASDEVPFTGRKQTVDYFKLKSDYEQISGLKTRKERNKHYQVKNTSSKPSSEEIQNLVAESNENGIWIEDITVHDMTKTMNPDTSFNSDPDFKKIIRGISTRTYINNMQTFMNYIQEN